MKFPFFISYLIASYTCFLDTPNIMAMSEADIGFKLFDAITLNIAWASGDIIVNAPPLSNVRQRRNNFKL